MNRKMEQFNIDVNEYNIQMLNQPTPESHHIDISIDGYIDVIMDAYTNMYVDGHINFTKDVDDLLMKKLKILTLTYLLMDMTMVLNVNIMFYLLMMI